LHWLQAWKQNRLTLTKLLEEEMDAVLNEEKRSEHTGEGRGDRNGPGGSMTSPEIHIDEELNLKGKICPYTFVESMLALEEMKIGEVLRVIVDYPPAASDVPKTLAREGYDILDVSKVNETDWAILVRNKEYEEG
jgi:tRNA 2-thiouridine synthesizing protein A